MVADVAGISLSTLLRNTMAPFQQGVNEEDSKGGSLIIKMDVEGKWDLRVHRRN